MDFGWLPLAAFILTALGWISRELWRWRKAKGQAAHDASETLKDKKALLEDLISKIEDAGQKEELQLQLDEVNAALLGLYAKRLRHTLKEAGLPAEEMLIADGRNNIQPQETAQLKGITEELKELPPFISAQDLLVLGDAYYHMRQYLDAEKIYDQILNLSPDNPDVLNNRGILLRQLERYEESLADFNRSLQIRPNHPVVLMNRGNTYNALGRYEKAIDDFNLSLKLRPDNPMTLSNRSIAYYYLKRYEEALADCNRSLELRPDDPDTLGNRGITYGHLERWNEALADFKRSLKLRPDDPNTLYNLACLYALEGKIDDTITNLEKAIYLDSKNREMAKTDEDFENVRNDPRFRKLVE
jgi:tetratricopeptide (TPR) repeat protein